MRDTAIYNTHPSVASIDGGVDALDINSSKVALDEALITAEITRLESLEPQRLVNSESLEYLKATDWYVTRFTESGVAVPADVTQARTDARLAVV